jgi:hypothetical protein
MVYGSSSELKSKSLSPLTNFLLRYQVWWLALIKIEMLTSKTVVIFLLSSSYSTLSDALLCHSLPLFAMLSVSHKTLNTTSICKNLPFSFDKTGDVSVAKTVFKSATFYLKICSWV